MSYLTTPTSFITVDGTQIAYREMSAGASRLPLVMLVHLAANLDNWDPSTISSPRAATSSSWTYRAWAPAAARFPRPWRRRASRRLALSEAWATSASTC